MARGRMLLKRISMSEKINKGLTCDTSRLLYTWILAHLDVNGCYYADPILVKNTIFPWREDISVSKIKQYLQEMRDCGLIILYGQNEEYLHYPDFIEKQPKINADREGKSDIPAPTQELIQSQSGVNQTQNKIREDKIREDVYDEQSDEMKLSTLLFDLVLNRNPNHKKPDINLWAIEMNKMIRIDKRSPEEIEKVIRWCQSDAGDGTGKWKGWQNNILSIKKLREKYDVLNIKRKSVQQNQPIYPEPTLEELVS